MQTGGKPNTALFWCLCAEMAEEEVYPDCDDSLLEEGETRDEDIVEAHSDLEFSDARQNEVCTHFVKDHLRIFVLVLLS